MDELPEVHYLGAIMLPRHLLALFALFSGIAALHAPAHASALQSVVQDARSTASSSECSASSGCECVADAYEQTRTRPRQERKQRLKWLPSWLRPSVIIGSDRALE